MLTSAAYVAYAAGRGLQKLSPRLKQAEARSYHQPESQALETLYTRLYQWTKSSSNLDQALRHPTFLPLLREKMKRPHCETIVSCTSLKCSPMSNIQIFVFTLKSV